jgi:hypothetical protein
VNSPRAGGIVPVRSMRTLSWVVERCLDGEAALGPALDGRVAAVGCDCPVAPEDRDRGSHAGDERRDGSAHLPSPPRDVQVARGDPMDLYEQVAGEIGEDVDAGRGALHRYDPARTPRELQGDRVCASPRVTCSLRRSRRSAQRRRRDRHGRRAPLPSPWVQKLDLLAKAADSPATEIAVARVV